MRSDNGWSGATHDKALLVPPPSFDKIRRRRFVFVRSLFMNIIERDTAHTRDFSVLVKFLPKQ